MNMLKFGSIFIFYMASTSVGVGAECDNIPHVASQFISEHRNWRVLKYDDLPNDDKQLWRKFHPRLCPGWTKVNFDNSDKNYYAVAFLAKNGSIEYEKIVIFRYKGNGVEIEKTIANDIIQTPLVLWTAKPGLYLNERNGKNVKISGESLIYEKMEAGSTQFFMVNGKILRLLASE